MTGFTTPRYPECLPPSSLSSFEFLLFSSFLRGHISHQSALKPLAPLNPSVEHQLYLWLCSPSLEKQFCNHRNSWSDADEMSSFLFFTEDAIVTCQRTWKTPPAAFNVLT
ncbi:hypothetical protein AVEN_206375-1 [Araneus ventricosus]|uniref:Uncharacterized protein n=1 Tax=Araneus ventricosus TaxID=182803 RepID=A0A4Y2VG90_ARAVE|nr:hypothetical protein AVEN_206375-1 [Araneus ventricosus]